MGVVVDVDNTLLPWGEYELPFAVQQWLDELLSAHIRCVLLSNSYKWRIDRIRASSNLPPCVYHACKPLRPSFKKAAKVLGLPPHQIAVVGDQLFTDILGGNYAGMVTILVPPLSRKEFIITRAIRQLETACLYTMKKKGLLRPLV